MFYYLYEVRCNLNGKIYVGVHKTKDLNDGYMGSGKVILAAIEKYGVENFTKTILEYFESKEAMYAREAEIVTEEFLARDDTYNLRRGGSGGFDYLNDGSELHISRTRKGRLLANEKLRNLYGDNFHSKLGSLGGTISYSRHGISEAFSSAGKTAFLGKTHNLLSKEKISRKNSKNQTGVGNSQFGTMWITNGIFNKKIKKSDEIPTGYRKGRILAHMTI
jgi:hypothetical protein